MFSLDFSPSHQVMQSAGVDGEQVVLLLEDHHLVSSAFLEMINSLLMSGEVSMWNLVE